MAHLIALMVLLLQLESGGDNLAVGDGGRSHGCLQISAAVVQDVNDHYNTKYDRQDAYNRQRSQEICGLYLLRWGRQYERETGMKASPEVLARIWVGGPDGWREDCTDPYWVRLKDLVTTIKLQRKINEMRKELLAWDKSNEQLRL